MVNKYYPNIDMKRTGLLLKFLVKRSGYSIHEIQSYLSLSCPQPIYRWYQGKILPTLDHLYALSKLFSIKVDDMIVEKHNQGTNRNKYIYMPDLRFYEYNKRLNKNLSRKKQSQA